VLIVITPETDATDEIQTVIKMFEEGLKTLHLRKPKADKQSMKAYLDQIPAEYHTRIVVHSNYDLLGDYKLQGIHITSETKEWFDILANTPEEKGTAMVVALFKQMIDGKTVSISCHSIDEIDEQSYKYDYYFLSPIFDSISKEGYQSKFELEKLKQFLGLRDKKIIALGGVDKENISLCTEAGFSGSAVLGAVWEAETVEERVERFKALVK